MSSQVPNAFVQVKGIDNPYKTLQQQNQIAATEEPLHANRPATKSPYEVIQEV